MQWSVRSLEKGDAAEVAAVFAASRGAAMPWLPVLHTPDEDVAFFASEIESSYGWGATEDGRLLGFALLRDDWLNHLYVAPGWRGSGVGSALLSRVVAQSTGPVDLWAFARNEPALAFYRRRGFEVVERTDGAGNEEKEPDVRMRLAPAVLVRTADVADADALASVQARSWRAAYSGIVDDEHLSGLDVGAFTRRWQDRLTGGQPGGRTRAAICGSAVVGFTHVGPPRDEDLIRDQLGWGEVYALYVDPDHWREGVGAALWRDVDAGWGADVAGVCLWVLAGNDRARHFYRACGLTPDGAQRTILIGKRELTEVRMVMRR